MSGKPAARAGDMTKYGGPIVQGSAGVFIGAPTGIACSVCPGGITSGNPVNPLLGAKVLPGETDIALPGPLPFGLSRSYSSYRTRTPAPVGIFGPGWKALFDIRLQLRDDELIINDNGGRSIHFEPLLPGETAFSRSESLWLARGGILKLHESNALHRLWQRLPEDIRLSPHIYLATSSPQGPWWILGWSERVPDVEEVLPAPLPPYRVLTGLADRFGRTLTFHRAAQGAFTGHITAVTDGAGRRFRLALSTLPQRAEAARQQAAASGVREQDWPQTPPASGYGPDSGIRLDAVWLVHDPAYPDNLPAEPLVRYAYTPRGELAAVYDRGGTQVRSFTYDDKHPGRMTAHQYAGRPQTTYRYDDAGRVVTQHNPGGLSYTYRYDRNTVTLTDSLNRREVLHTEGEGGLKRVVKKAQADGSSIFSEFDHAGRLLAQTDEAGRRTQYRLNVGSGQVTEAVAPDGRSTRFYYGDLRQLTDTVWPDGLRTRRVYDEQGRLTKETSREGSTTRWFYAGPQDELPCAMQDATGSKKSMVRNRYGQVLTFTDCSGCETRYEYNRFGQITAIHQEEGLSRYFVYDSRGRLISRQDAQGHETRYEYSVAGDLTAVIHPDGSRSETRYDERGNVLSTTQGGLTRSVKYDRAGRITTLTNENGAATTFTYDVMDRLVQETGFDGRTQRYGYSPTGQLIRSEDESLVTLWHYDNADRLIRCTVSDEPAEEWQYNEQGWLTEISHPGDGHRVAVHYGYDDKGRMVSERQTVDHTETGERLWEHETKHAYSEQGLAYQTTPDHLPPVEWLTYGSGYLAGMKAGDMPLADFTRDRLHRETQRTFGAYELATTYTPAGQLQGHTLNLTTLNRDYGYSDSGQLVRISGPGQQSHYQYDDAGRLRRAHLTPADVSETYLTDPAGNRIADRTQYPALPVRFPDNRISEDAHWFYHHDEHGRLTRKDERNIRDGGSHSHHYHYDHRHRLVHYRLTQQGQTLRESRYLYDPQGRRVGKKVWYGADRMPAVTWYGHDGDRLTTTQTEVNRIQTVYLPGSFTPLLRIETEMTELAQAGYRTLAQKLQQDANVTFPPVLVAMLDGLEAELRRGEISAVNQQWLAQCGLTPEQMVRQLEPVYTPLRKLHLYHCDHRGLPLALVCHDGRIAWQAEYDAWGNVLRENNPDGLEQLIRLPGQQYDAEAGLCYNRHRYYDPAQGRYITQDPIGLKGGLNPYVYALNPISWTDPLGLWVGIDDIVFSVGGAIVGLAGQGVSDLISGELSGWEDYTGSAIGGAAGGEALLYTGPIGAGAAAGAATNLSKQGLKYLSGKQCGFEWSSLVGDTAIGAATGFIPGIKVQGITVGRGSYNSIFKQMTTKASNGTISSMKPRTAAKMFLGRAVDTSLVPGAAVGAVGGVAESAALEKLDSLTCDPCKCH
ncbi:RHS element core protein [Enterobacter cloacae]|uniref:RHS element core protein n=1 Tax=Enterobacter cloacae TaxID=550 RepID=UPI0014829347|nr:RHS element core protein [Enterobacter cloacae]HEG1988793.1 RHS repeat protein [Enterobacter cloacae]